MTRVPPQTSIIAPSTLSNDDLYGLRGNDTIFGGDGNDWLDGGTGNDFLMGRPGDDALIWGGGDDILVPGIAVDAQALEEARLCAFDDHDRIRIVRCHYFASTQFRADFD